MVSTLRVQLQLQLQLLLLLILLLLLLLLLSYLIEQGTAPNPLPILTYLAVPRLGSCRTGEA